MQEQECCPFISITHYVVLHGTPLPAFKKQNFTVNMIHSMNIISITEGIKEEINNIYLYKYKWIGQHYYSSNFNHKAGT
jgi:hypothetical protein